MDSDHEPPIYRVLVSLLWGVIITVALTVAVFVFDAPVILLWQARLFSSFFPPHNIGTPEEPFYEGTPVQLVAIPIGIVLGIPIYAVLAFVVWWLKEKVKER